MKLTITVENNAVSTLSFSASGDLRRILLLS